MECRKQITVPKNLSSFSPPEASETRSQTWDCLSDRSPGEALSLRQRTWLGRPPPPPPFSSIHYSCEALRRRGVSQLLMGTDGAVSRAN
ncbi:hypothetical protein PBY51_019627 [Eleginops maclovinus]|uniref:Uncharacterized protein n=1 Tax=Eleginops maclovinus TaxID=56733 RepID=A0AAN8AS92_ELEMC|nr:hypothetical protein PBY51_019627 [Eleginops maclovinus]